MAESIKMLCIKNNSLLNDLLEAASVVEDSDQINKEIDTILEIKTDETESITDMMESADFLTEADNILKEELRERPCTPIDLDALEQQESPFSEGDIIWEQFETINEESKAKKESKRNPTEYFCPACGLSFPSKTRCLYHERKKHNPVVNNERPYVCDR